MTTRSAVDVPAVVGVGRRIGIAGLAALTGGVLVLGVGGRLAMRLSGAMAIVNNPDTRFMLTGDGFRIGRITLDDTLGLIVFGGVFGSIIAGSYWALLKDRLAGGRLGLAGLVAFAIGGNAFVKPDNIDFVILEPVVMNVVLYPLLAGLAGIAIVAIDRTLTKRGFASGPVGGALLSVFAVAGAGLGGTLALVALADEPAMGLELLILGLVAVPLWIEEAGAWNAWRWLHRSANVVAVVVVAVEWTRLLRSAWSILG